MNTENNTVDNDYDDDGLSFANRPKKDNNGFITGKVTKIETYTFINQKKRTSKEFADDLTTKALRFVIMVDGVVEPIRMSKTTGTNVRPDKIHIKAKGRGSKETSEYNALTEMCLRLNIFKSEDLTENNPVLLENIRKYMKQTSTENPIYIRAKLVSSSNEERQFETVDMKTIETIDSPKVD